MSTIPTPPRGRCVLSWARSQIDAEDRDALDDLLFDRPHVNNYQVAELLGEEWGLRIDYQVIQRHRRHRCITCNREAEHEPVQASPHPD